MSLFKWSTPERRSPDRMSPIIPNEIYLHIFEHIARPTGPLAPEELRIFTNLSRVCRFFANVCLPRIFEFVEFTGSIFRDDTPTALRNDAVYKTSRESTLCTQITAKQPLALALAKTVRACHFRNWKLDETGSWAVRLFAKKYIAGMSRMINVRELKFSESFVDTEHWNAIATLGSLEELSFDSCEFLQGPADVEPNKWVKVKVPRLRLTYCTGDRQPIAAIDARYIRTLAIDYKFFKQADWLPQSALTELHLSFRYTSSDRLHAVLMRAPKSLETLWLSIGITPGLALDIVESMLNDPAWKNLPLLRSFTLWGHCVDSPTQVISSTLEGIGLLTNLQSFTLKDYCLTLDVPPTQVQRILHDKLGTTSNLKRVDIYGRAFHLVDGEWSEVSSSTT